MPGAATDPAGELVTITDPWSRTKRTPQASARTTPIVFTSTTLAKTSRSRDSTSPWYSSMPAVPPVITTLRPATSNVSAVFARADCLSAMAAA